MRYDTRALDETLTKLFEKRKLPGISVCMLDAEGEVFAKGYGFADAEKTRPVDADTVYGVASMSKSMTALACAILATEGKLSLEDPVYKYFPDFTIAGTPRDAVTLRHLAMHTAGIPPMEPLEWSIAMNAEGRDSEWLRKLQKTAPNKMETIGQIIDYIAGCGYPALGEPGEIMSYSNEAYAILSYVVDQAAGVPLEDFLQDRLFTPLGMTRTVLDNGPGELARKISGGNITSLFEREEDGTLKCDDCWSVLPPFRGCAMVKSTARNMAAYYRCLSNYGMHEGKQVIPREAVELLIGRAHPARREPVYALGLYKRDWAGHVVCEHSGGLHGVSSHGGLLLGEGFGFTALCNLGDGDAVSFVWPMYNLAMGLPVETPCRWFAGVGHEFSDPQMLEGTFRSHEGVPVDVTLVAEDGSVFAIKEDKRQKLTYCGGLQFAVFNEEGGAELILRAYVRNGHTWAVKCGSRVFQRVESEG